MAVNSNADYSKIGQTALTGDEYALFLKVFSGEVLTSFEEKCVMKGLHVTRTITHGKSAQFPVLGTATAKYHTPGQSLLEADNGYMNHIEANEKVISIDRSLVAPVFIAQIEEAMNHYDIRAPYAAELGRALANKYDRQCLQLVALAAQASANISTGSGGSVLNKGTTILTDGDALAAAIFSAAQTLDEKNVPENDRYCVVSPQLWYLLVNSTKTLNRDYNGFNGTYADGTVMKVAGIQIVKSNHLPSGVISNDTGANNTYGGTFTNYRALVFQKEAIGTVNLLDLAMESEYSVEHQGTLMVAKMAVGHGILRPECAVAITSA